MDATRLIHNEQVRPRLENRSLVSPVYYSTKYTLPSLNEVRSLFAGESSDFIYARSSNPTTRELELILSEMQGVEDGRVFASGLAAISNVLLSLLQSGDKVVSFLEGYAPSRKLLREWFPKFGVTSQFFSLNNLSDFEEFVRANKPKLCLFESPANPTLKVANVSAIVEICKRAGTITVFDNTFSGLHNHHNLGIDLYVHSLTKFVIGHGDSMGGAVLGSKEIIKRLLPCFLELASPMDPHSASLALRGLKTYELRYQKQSENALKVATFLGGCQKVGSLRYPGLESHPDHESAKKQQRDFGSVIFFDFDLEDSQSFDRFFESLSLFSISASLGSVDSLVVPADLFYGASLTPVEKKAVGLTPFSVRLSIGLEDPRDLIADLKQALSLI